VIGLMFLDGTPIRPGRKGTTFAQQLDNPALRWHHPLHKGSCDG
jgi:hypothetical protein